MPFDRRLSVCLIGLIAGGRSGVPRYAAALARALDSISGDYPHVELSLATTVRGREAVGPRNIRVIDFHLSSRCWNAGAARVASEQLVAASRRADLLHFFDLTGPVLAPRRPFVTTMHDASLTHGQARKRHSYKRWLWPWALRRAAAVVAVTAFAKDEAIRNLGVEPDKIKVIHSGPGFSEPLNGERSASATDRAPFFLYVGDLTVRKNVPFLVRAFDRAAVDATLVLVGAADDGSDAVRDEIDRARRPDRIRLAGHATDEELDGLYRSAVALVMPSRYEGFGFTPLEAMARGCPVIASDIPAFREVSGSGALLLPLDEARWSDSLRRVAADEAFRQTLRQRGARTVARYSWEKAARELYSLFLAVGGRVRG